MSDNNVIKIDAATQLTREVLDIVKPALMKATAQSIDWVMAVQKLDSDPDYCAAQTWRKIEMLHEKGYGIVHIQWADKGRCEVERILNAECEERIKAIRREITTRLAPLTVYGITRLTLTDCPETGIRAVWRLTLPGGREKLFEFLSMIGPGANLQRFNAATRYRIM